MHPRPTHALTEEEEREAIPAVANKRRFAEAPQPPIVQMLADVTWRTNSASIVYCVPRVTASRTCKGSSKIDTPTTHIATAPNWVWW